VDTVVVSQETSQQTILCSRNTLQGSAPPRTIVKKKLENYRVYLPNFFTPFIAGGKI
jgi:hypothetical protein